MCGRLNITDDPFSRLISEIVGVTFSTPPNPDLRPTDLIAVLGANSSTLCQKNLAWGIKPPWAKRVIINAQSETVAAKPTFRGAFLSNRVVVPCAGWYEWAGEKDKKQKFLFSNLDENPLFMAGIAINEQLVTLTTKPNKQYSKFHHRMPLLIPEGLIEQWTTGLPENCLPMLAYHFDDPLAVDAQ